MSHDKPVADAVDQEQASTRKASWTTLFLMVCFFGSWYALSALGLLSTPR